ncbi:MAG: toll/interleukin-1 receptor domain-containing protein [Planctomycetota bacterium]
MKVFISWSGNMSREVAEVLRKYLPCVIQGMDTFMSKHDLESGARWSLQLAKELDEASFGILCLTPDNLQNPWILFEAGALTKHLEGRACGLLLNGLHATEVSGPLSQFQNRTFDKHDFAGLLHDINQKVKNPLSAQHLDLTFEKWWPDLEREAKEAMTKTTSAISAPRRDQRDILEEVLSKVRGIERTLNSVSLPSVPANVALKASFDFGWSKLNDTQRRLLAELVSPMGRRVVVSADQVLKDYSSDDLRALEELGLIRQAGDSVLVVNNLIAAYVREKVTSE